jgi:hypothetical protein
MSPGITAPDLSLQKLVHQIIVGPSDRQPLIRPESANEVWSMDFVFDRVAGGRMLKCLVIVDDATHESVAIVVEHTAVLRENAIRAS